VITTAAASTHFAASHANPRRGTIRERAERAAHFRKGGPTMTQSTPDYILGHSDPELARLDRQARLLDPVTRQYFEAAGIAPGMRVLDVGSGAGHTAILAAQLVGSAGEVVGTDRVAKSVATATNHAKAKGFANASFREGDPAEMRFERPFDAIVGRYVLIFQAEPGQWLAGLIRHLRPGGLVVFHEPDGEFACSLPPVPTYDRCMRWVAETFGNTGTRMKKGRRLRDIFLEAGLPTPNMRMQVAIGDALSAADWLRALAELVLAIAPAMRAHGIATAAEIAEIEHHTFADRLVKEVAASGSLVIGRAEIGAWSRRPQD
jgi:2-polyprenyl-3-methyl-5-hydroxy-6-metoxy-1,4-benzoquinol methylase